MAKAARQIFCGLVLVGLGGFVLFSLGSSLLGRYIDESPRAPVAETGHVYGYNSHGVTVYFSKEQRIVLGSIWVLGVGFLAGGAYFLRDFLMKWE